MFLYKLDIVEEIEDHDYTAHNDLAYKSLKNIKLDASSLNGIIYSDDCVIQVDRKVNNHDVIIPGSEKSHQQTEIGSGGGKVYVWYV